MLYLISKVLLGARLASPLILYIAGLDQFLVLAYLRSQRMVPLQKAYYRCASAMQGSGPIRSVDIARGYKEGAGTDWNTILLALSI